jgi:hypothetical protein
MPIFAYSIYSTAKEKAIVLLWQRFIEIDLLQPIPPRLVKMVIKRIA